MGDGALITYDNTSTTDFTDNYVSEVQNTDTPWWSWMKTEGSLVYPAITEVMAGKKSVDKITHQK